MRVSQPKPGASGKTAARARDESARCPESGSTASNPESRRISRRAIALGQTEPAADALAEDRDVDVRVPGEQRSQVAAEVGVAQEQPARRRRPLGRRERLPLAQAAKREHGCAGGLGPLGRAVARAVVGDEHLRLRKPRTQRLHGLADRRFLVPGGDEDRQRLLHPVVGTTGSTGGRTGVLSSFVP